MQPDTIANNLKIIKNRIEQAALRANRSPKAIRLVSVGKTQTSETIRMAGQAGAKIIGENYIQESREKFNDLIDMQLQWHFIGHLQSNKAKYAVRMFNLIHSVDSEKLAIELDKYAGKNGKVQNILIQVNNSGEKSKSGVSQDQAIGLITRISQLPNVRIKGLMTMPPFFDQPQRARPYFAALRQLQAGIQSKCLPGVDMTELSMGMTGDFEVAIEEGATLVRIGTAIFGERR